MVLLFRVFSGVFFNKDNLVDRLRLFGGKTQPKVINAYKIQQQIKIVLQLTPNHGQATPRREKQ